MKFAGAIFSLSDGLHVSVHVDSARASIKLVDI